MEKPVSWRESVSRTVKCWRMWWRLCPGILQAMTLEAVVKAVTPYVSIYFSARIIEELSQGRNPRVLAQWVLIALGVTVVLQLLGGGLTRWVAKKKGEAGVLDNKVYMEKMMELDYALLQDQSVYGLYNQIAQNARWNGWGVHMAVDQFQEVIHHLLGVVIGLGVSVGLLAYQVPQESALAGLNHPACLLAVGVVMVGIAVLSPMCDTRSNGYWAKYDKNVLFGNRAYFAYGYETKDARRALDMRMYEQQRKVCQVYLDGIHIFDTSSTLARYMKGPMGLWGALGKGISALFTGIVYLYVCLKAWAGAFGVDGVAQYVGAVTMLFSGVSGLLTVLGELQLNANYLGICFEFLETPNQMYQGSLTTEKRSDRNYQVEFRDVSFRYPDSEAWALRHVNLKFQVGSRLAVVGENGSGKSTFIKLLCRLYDPTEGEILLNGIDIRKYQYPDYIALFSVVFQDFHLLALPLGQNVAGRTKYEPELVTRCLTQAGVVDRVEKMDQGLDTYLYKDLEKKGVEVSGGEAQKIAIARALYKDAPFIILDEPTAALDPIAEAEVYSKFDQIAGDKTAVYISHRLSSCKFCDDIVVFDHGHIVQQGSHQQLVSVDGVYARLWQAQAQYYEKQES